MGTDLRGQLFAVCSSRGVCAYPCVHACAVVCACMLPCVCLCVLLLCTLPRLCRRVSKRGGCVIGVVIGRGHTSTAKPLRERLMAASAPAGPAPTMTALPRECVSECLHRDTAAWVQLCCCCFAPLQGEAGGHFGCVWCGVVWCLERCSQGRCSGIRFEQGSVWCCCQLVRCSPENVSGRQLPAGAHRLATGDVARLCDKDHVQLQAGGASQIFADTPKLVDCMKADNGELCPLTRGRNAPHECQPLNAGAQQAGRNWSRACVPRRAEAVRS